MKKEFNRDRNTEEKENDMTLEMKTHEALWKDLPIAGNMSHGRHYQNFTKGMGTGSVPQCKR